VSSTTATPEAMRQRFDALEDSFERKADRCGLFERTLHVAGHVILLRFAGRAMIDNVWPALSHLELSSPAPTRVGLTIDIWDGATAGVEPTWSTAPTPIGAKEIRPISFTADLICFDELGSALNFLDYGRSVALYCAEDAAKLPSWDRGSPLRHVLNWWLQTQGLQLVHSAAVGRAGGVVLLAGKGGSGKSTTALACLRAGLDYLGDDYVLLRPFPPHAYSLYGSAKLETEHWGHHSWLLPGASHAAPGDEKVLGFVDGAYLGQRAAGLPVVAVVLPQVTARPRTQFISTSAARGLMALAPSTVLQLRSGAPSTLESLASLLRQVPTFALELGGDVDSVPTEILSLLDQLGVA
jgi:hypothetical protein